MNTCFHCGGPVGDNEVGLNKKIISRSAERFLCIHCLANHFKTTEASLLSLIERLRATGCLLFPQH